MKAVYKQSIITIILACGMIISTVDARSDKIKSAQSTKVKLNWTHPATTQNSQSHSYFPPNTKSQFLTNRDKTLDIILASHKKVSSKQAFEVGILYQVGDQGTLKKNLNRSIQWLGYAAKHNHSPAQLALSVSLIMKYEQTHNERWLIEAISWATIAKKRGIHLPTKLLYHIQSIAKRDGKHHLVGKLV